MKKFISVMVLSAALVIPARAVDFNGDGHDDIAVFKPASGLWAIRGISRVYFGNAADIPVPADYGAAGRDSAAIFRPYSGLWAIAGGTRAYFGEIDDEAHPGDYNGNGTCDVAIFRRSNGLWAVTGVTRVYFGSSSDIAITDREKNYNHLPVTGQTTKYDDYDDGDYQTGRPFRFLTFSIDGDLVTIDTNTGLMWAADGDENGCDGGMTGKWVPALQTCHDLLNFAGFNDWRLPNVKELQSIVDYETSVASPCVDETAFPNTKQSLYWSSTTFHQSASLDPAMCVSFANGGVVTMSKDESNVYLRAVRGGR